MTSQISKLNVLFLLLLVTVTVILSCAKPVLAETLYIGVENCADSERCLSQDREYEIVPCCSLEYVSKSFKERCSNLTIIISIHILKLNSLVSFGSCNNISIIGSRKDGPNIIICEENQKLSAFENDSNRDIRATPNFHIFSAFNKRLDKIDRFNMNALQSMIPATDSPGFLFRETHGLVVRNLKITGCGPVKSGQDNKMCNSSFLLVNCSNVQISNTHFENNTFTSVYFINMNGYVMLESVLFVKNQQSVSQKEYIGATFPSGLLVHFENSTDTSVCFFITNCTFDTNHAPEYFAFVPKLKTVLEDWMPFGLGGALGLIFMNRVHGINVEITDSRFLNNRGVWGAGLCIQFQQHSYNNSVSVMSSVFRNNNGTMAGGGVNVRFGRIVRADDITTVNSVSFQNSKFENNTGRYGGGVLVFASASDIKTQPGCMVRFVGCQWLNNFGRYSPAVDISPFRFDEKSSGFLPIPTFTDCTFAHNRIVPVNKKHTIYINSGVFVVTHFEVQFGGNVKFLNNSLTALYITWGRAVFNTGSSVLFINNTGIRGGAVIMYGFSILGLGDNSTFKFIGNHAKSVGGGIYYESTEQREYFEGRRCFLEYMGTTEEVPKRNLMFVFQNNTADESGSSIYSASFYACFFRYYGKLTGTNRSITDFFEKIGYFEFNGKTELDDTLFGTYGMLFSSKKETLLAMPGKRVKLGVHLLDEFNKTLANNYVIKIDGNSSLKLKSIYTSKGSIIVMGPPGRTATLTVSTQHPIRSVHCQLKVSVISCSPGFFYNETSDTCTCSADNPQQSYSAINKCDYSKFRAYIDHGYWAGYYHDDSYNASNLYTALCPMQFCSNSSLQTSKLMPSNSSRLTHFMCHRRTGVLCGFCTDGLSVYFHSREYHCGNETLCSYGLIFYFASELLPVVILFSVIIFSNLSFTSGNVNGFILFSQCLDIIAINFKDYQFESFHELPLHFKIQRYLQHTYEAFYDILNLDFFRFKTISFCIFKTRGVMPVLAIKYATTVFAFLLVVCLIALLNSDTCGRIWRRCNRCDVVNASYIHGISAFLVLCYAQCTRITFFILTWANLTGNSEANPQSVAVTYYGGLHYFGKEHIPYALPALLCLCTIVVLPPLLLISYPLVLQFLGRCGLGEHRVVVLTLRMSQVHRLVPMLDSFQASFKDNMRCFAGLYFLYRVALLAVYSFWRSSTVYYALSEFLLISFLGIHAVAQPYARHMHNVIDGLLFANLAVINGLSAFSVVALQDKQLRGKWHNKPPLYIGYAQLTLIYLPMIIALGVLIKNCCVDRCKRGHCAKRRGIDDPPVTPEEERSLIHAEGERVSIIDSSLTPDIPVSIDCNTY